MYIYICIYMYRERLPGEEHQIVENQQRQARYRLHTAPKVHRLPPKVDKSHHLYRHINIYIYIYSTYLY